MELIWWDSLVQSLGGQVFLRIRGNAGLSAMRITRRLDPDEPSSGDLCSYSDSWVRASPGDWAALHRTLAGAQGRSVLFFDVWGHLLSGVSLRDLQRELRRAIDACAHCVLLFPRFDIGQLRQPTLGQLVDDQVRLDWTRMVDRLQGIFEFFLNLDVRCTLIESSLPEDDASRALQLDFRFLRRWLGLFHVLPRDVAWSQVGYADVRELCDTLCGVLEQLEAGGAPPHLLRMQKCSPRAYAIPDEQGRRSLSTFAPFVRRADGVVALPVGWRRYLQLAASSRGSGASGFMPLAPQNQGGLPREEHNLEKHTLRRSSEWAAPSLLSFILRLDGEDESARSRPLKGVLAGGNERQAAFRSG